MGAAHTFGDGLTLPRSREKHYIRTQRFIKTQWDPVCVGPRDYHRITTSYIFRGTCPGLPQRILEAASPRSNAAPRRETTGSTVCQRNRSAARDAPPRKRTPARNPVVILTSVCSLALGKDTTGDYCDYSTEPSGQHRAVLADLLARARP